MRGREVTKKEKTIKLFAWQSSKPIRRLNGDKRQVLFITQTLDLNRLFFFQSEDGIRHPHVTGVQTCALPIEDGQRPPVAGGGGRWLDRPISGIADHLRSEERRVGKECRSRWSPYH